MDAAAKIALAKKLSDGIDTFQSICIAFLVLITVTFTLRMFSRIYIVRCFEAEDWTMVVAFVRKTLFKSYIRSRNFLTDNCVFDRSCPSLLLEDLLEQYSFLENYWLII